MKRRYLTVASLSLSLAACLVVPVAALASETPELDEASTTISIDQSSLPDSDELLAGYFEQRLAGEGDLSLFGEYGEASLTGNDLLVYRQLKTAVQNIASGSRTAAKIVIDTSGFNDGVLTYYSASDLGVDSLVASGSNSLTSQATKALAAKTYSLNLVVDTLLVDCPYDLYWYDKTAGCGANYSLKSKYVDGELVVAISGMTIYMTPESYYASSSSSYTVDTARTGAASAAATKAKAIVAECESLSDYQKLVAYKEKICDLVSYNDDAASSTYTDGYGNPWQVIYVFDGDANTNVVCEGYAKAFQYLCDLTTFKNDIECYTVDGTFVGGTGSGDHMWNIVRVNGTSYLVDVTNCDTGTIGNPAKLFLAGTANGSVSSGYSFTFSSHALKYQYSGDTRSLYDEAVLTLSSTKCPEFDDPEEVEPIDLSEAAVTLSGANGLVYDGSPKEPPVSVVLDGDTLEVKEDYAVSYSNNVNAGTATVTVTGTGDYTGSAQASFTISRAANEISGLSCADITFGETPSPSATATYGTPEFSYSASKSGEYGDWDASWGAGTYYVKASVSASANYEAAEAVASFKVGKRDISDAKVSSVSRQTYTGSSIKPTLSVTYDGEALEAGTDYTVSYSNNVNAGTATVKLVGKGNYSGTKSVAFEIARASLSAATVDAIADQTYAGSAIEPDVVVRLGDATLVAGTDYTVSFSDNVEPGTATVTVTGAGNYEGTLTATFGIAEPASSPSVRRLWGATALDTMAAVSQEGFADGSCDSVVLATMGGYWDALSATALAGRLGCPVLLTSPSSLSAQAASEISRLGAKTVYVAGGEAAVSAAVESQVRELGAATVRLAGDNAQLTALEVYEEGLEHGGWGETAVVATSETFHDALSGAPYAYAEAAPVFLTNGDGTALDERVLSAIESGGFSRVLVLGGEAAVGPAVAESLSGLGLEVRRLWGDTAVDTSAEVAEFCLSEGMSAANAGVATGTDYYDALTGASLCGSLDSPLVLATDSRRSAVASVLGANASSVELAYVFGGEAAVSAGTYAAVEAALGL